MIQESARNILRAAEDYSNATNSSYLDFNLSVSLLNTEYRKLYDEIVSNSNDFTKTVTVGGGTTLLPNDCYLVLAVYDHTGTPLSRQGLASSDIGGYTIVNGAIVLPKGLREVKVVYSTLPATVTAPDEAIEIDSSNVPTDKKNYFVEMNKAGEVSFSENNNTKYLGKDFSYDLTSQSFSWDGVDASSLLSRPNTTIVNIQHHSPYMLVSYSDGVILVYTGWQKAVWNYNCIFGHETLGEIVALKTNDITGKGAVWLNYDDNKYYYVSFVPDTILNYPTSTLFTLLTYRLASVIGSLLSMDTNYLDEKLIPEAETNFYKTLSFGNVATRINNKSRSQVRYGGGW